MKKTFLVVSLLIVAFSLFGCVPGPSKTTVIQVPAATSTPPNGVKLDINYNKSIGIK